MSGKVYKKGNTFYVDPQYNERYYGPVKINNNLEWIGRDGTSTMLHFNKHINEFLYNLL